MLKKLKSLKSKIKKKVTKGINTKNLKKNIKSKYVPTLKLGAKKAFELGKKGAKAAYAELERRHKENLAKQAAQKKYEEINPPKKSGGFFTALAGAAAAGAAKNKMSPPMVVPPSDYVILGMKPSGIGSWSVQYAKRSQMNLRRSFTVTRGVKGKTIGSDKFHISWSS